MVLIGVLSPPSPAECAAHAEEVASRLRRMGRDRFLVEVLTQNGGVKDKNSGDPDNPDPTAHWPSSHVLVCCLSRASVAGTFPFDDARRYVDRSRLFGRSVMVMTDLDLDRTLSDRAVFYDTLEAGGLGFLLPRRAAVRCVVDGREENKGSYSPSVVDRRDLIEVGGKVLLKPVLERPLDPDDPEVRIYYPRSEGGGCKVVTYDKDGKNASSFLPDASIRGNAAARKDGNGDDKQEAGISDKGFVYEELFLDGKESASTSTSTTGGEERERRYRKRDRLRDAAAVIVPSGLLRRDKGTGEVGVTSYYDDEEITWDSDLSRPDRKFWIVTTAALPWMTGTAVNPLLRAAYLSRGRRNGSVTLVIPWLERSEDRAKLYGSNEFADETEQERYIREWLRDKAGMKDEADEETGLHLLFYPARYHAQLGSIFAMGDIAKLIPDEDADVCVLEEPEHLNWFRASGDAWTDKFTFVVGIVHTNYKAYASAHLGGIVAAPIISGMSTLMVRAYCHKVIKLSAVLQTFAPEKEVVCNVHGVRAEFLEEGERRAKALCDRKEQDIKEKADDDGSNSDTCVYFIGKILWAKGLDRLLHLEDFYKKCTGEYFRIDIYGDGPEITEIRRAYHGRSGGKKRRAAASLIKRLAPGTGAAAVDGGEDKAGTQEVEDMVTDDSAGGTTERDEEDKSSRQIGDDRAPANADNPAPNSRDLSRKSSGDIELPLAMQQWRMNPVPARFLGRKDHAALTEQYKVIVNPSITEVLCTTTAEALAMGKFAIIPVHPSNTFFLQFPNCLAFRNKLEFAANLKWALTHEPEPLTEEFAYQFTWEAATERFIRASAITMREGRVRAKAKKSRLDERIAYFHNRLGGGQKGDVLRTILGAGPASGQTKYELSRQRANSFSSDISLPSETIEDEAERRRERIATFMSFLVLALFAIFILWRDWPHFATFLTSDEL